MYKAAIRLIKIIEDHGFKAYIVGGYPRDLYLKRKSTDIDICTNATPMQIKDIFGDAVLPNVSYGSVTVIYKNIRFEITTFRKEIKYENNRQPVKIKYIDSLIDDLKRRDFTINTLCIDVDGNIIDLLGGKKDIDNKIIKVVGNTKQKITEDALRILRAIRFATVLNFNLDETLKKNIKKYGYLLKKLSYYRKKEELDKIFSSPNVKYGINLIKELGLVQHLELSNIDKLVITSSAIGIWAQLGVVDIYNFTSNERELINKINELSKLDVLDEYNLYKYGLYISTIVGEIHGIDRKKITHKYNNLYIYSLSEISISAPEICELLNKKPGCFLKEIFSDIEKKIVYKELENYKDVLKDYIISKYRNITER